MWMSKYHVQCCDCLQPPPSLLPQSDYPYHENIPSIKISMDMMEQEPILGVKSLDSEY